MSVRCGEQSPRPPLQRRRPAGVVLAPEGRLLNLLGVCLFASITLAVKPSTWARLASAAVGYPISKEELLLAAERTINLERLVNARLGFDRKDDTLPRRFTEERAVDGRGEGEVVDLAVILDEYYESMGWDRATGLPTKEKLAGLGLDRL